MLISMLARERELPEQVACGAMWIVPRQGEVRPICRSAIAERTSSAVLSLSSLSNGAGGAVESHPSIWRTVA